MKIVTKITAWTKRHSEEMILLILGFWIRMVLCPLEVSPDYMTFLAPWMDQYQKLSFQEGMASHITDYYEPYNIFLNIVSHTGIPHWLSLSLFSILFEYLSVYFLYRILSKHQQEKNGAKCESDRRVCFAAIMILFLPQTILNGAVWKQCDAIYTCFAIIAIYYYLEEKYQLAFFFLGVGFTFKLQTIFIVAVFGIVWLVKRNFSLFYFLWIPVLFGIAGLPALAAGKSWKDTYLIYYGQTGEYQEMYLGNPSIYRLIHLDYGRFKNAAIILCGIILLLAAYCIAKNRDLIEHSRLLLFAGWCVMTCYLFLPAMHERYDYTGLVLLAAYAIGQDKKLQIPVGILLISNLYFITTVFYRKTGHMKLNLFMTIVYLIAYAVISKNMFIRKYGDRTLSLH